MNATTTPASKVHRRFWQRMSEAFGAAWFERHGPDPSVAWVKLLDDYPESTLRDALARMSEQKWEFPPTLPVFASFLAKVHAGSAHGGPDHVAGYWRSVILAAVLRDGAILTQLWPWGMTLQQLPRTHAVSVIAHVDALTAEVTEMERRTGQRTVGMQEHVQRRCEKFVRALHAGSTAQERSA